MRKIVFHYLLITSLLAVFAAPDTSAQQEVPVEEIDIIVDEALDLIEERIDGTAAPADAELPEATVPATGNDMTVPEKSIEPALSAAPPREITAATPAGTVIADPPPVIPFPTEVFKPEFVTITDIIDRVRQQLTAGAGKTEIDEKAGSISVTDTPEAIEKIRALIKEADRFNKAVRIETKILRIVLNEEHARGVDWEAIVSDYQSMDVPGFNDAQGAASAAKLSLGVVTKEDYAVLLDALDTVGVITTVGEETDTIDYDRHKAVKIPSVHQSGEGDVSDVAGHISIDMFTSYNSDGTQTVAVKLGPGAGVPGRAAEKGTAGAEVRVENEGTVVIGGLFEEVMVESTWKVPLLGDLPFLGFVFRNEGEVPRRAEVITFLTLKTVEKI